MSASGRGCVKTQCYFDFRSLPTITQPEIIECSAFWKAEILRAAPSFVFTQPRSKADIEYFRSPANAASSRQPRRWYPRNSDCLAPGVYFGTDAQSARAPEIFTTSAQRATSSRSCRSNSSGVLPTGSAPCSRRRLRVSGELAALITAAARVLTVSRGVAAGASRPNHSGTSTPSTPASFIVGSSGISSVRLAPATASARRRPDFTCGPTATGLMKDSWTSPASSAAIEGALPLYGTCTMLVPLRSLKSSAARCCVDPAPAEE